MANGFDSAGAGFSRGFASGRQLKMAKQQVKAQQQSEQAKQFKETLDAAREQSLETFTEFTDLARQAAERGATPEQLEEFRKGATASLASYGQTLEQIRAQATQLGHDPSTIPSGRAFVEQHSALFDSAIQAGSMMTPGATGAREADAKIAEAERLATSLGVPVDRVAQAMNLVPNDPEPERVGQRVVRGVGEAEVFRDKTSNLLFIQDEQGNRRVVASSDLTTPITRAEQGSPGSFDPRTQAQQGEAVTQFQDAAIGSTSAIESASSLLQIASQSPESLGAPGAMLRIGNEFIRTAVALGGMLGTDVGAERDVDSFTYDGFSGALQQAAIENQAFRAGVYGVAFAAAVAEQGARPTDKDIQAFIDQIGGSTADPKAFARTVEQFVSRIDRRLRTTARVKNIPKEIQDAAFGELDRALGEFKKNLPTSGGDAGADLAAQAEAAIAAGDLEKAEQLIEQIERGN